MSECLQNTNCIEGRVVTLCNVTCHKQIQPNVPFSFEGSRVKLNEKDLLMMKATATVSLLYCTRQVGYHLLSQLTGYILTDLESSCQVCFWNIYIFSTSELTCVMSIPLYMSECQETLFKINNLRNTSSECIISGKAYKVAFQIKKEMF